MRRTRLKTISVVATLLALGAMACGDAGQGSREDTRADDGSTTSEVDAGTMPGLATQVTLRGGKHAGTYARDTQNGVCIDYQQLGLGADDPLQGLKAHAAGALLMIVPSTPAAHHAAGNGNTEGHDAST